MKQQDNPNKRPSRIRRWVASRVSAIRTRVHRDVEAATEPIDFSAPSIPYYDGLANRFGLARMILYLVLFLFLVGTILFNTNLITYKNLYYLVKDINAASLTAQTPSEYIGYPVSSNEPEFALYRNGLVVAGSQEITALSASGKKTISDNVSYADPCVRSSDAYFITFGRGEHAFSVYNAFVCVYSEEDTEFPIYDASIAENGNFAITTRNKEYKSEVLIYNRDMNKVSAHRTNRYVTHTAWSADGERLAIVSVGADTAGVYSYLEIVRPGHDESLAKVQLNSTALYHCEFLSSVRVAVMGDRGTMIYSTSGELVAEPEMGGPPKLWASNASEGQMAFLLQDPDAFFENHVKIFDKFGKLVHTISVPLETDPLDMIWSDEYIYLRTTDSVIRLSPQKDTAVAQLTIPGNVYAIQVLKDGQLLVCTPSYAYLPEADQWKTTDNS